MDYRWVECPKFTKRDPVSGVVISIQCKICGAVIADTVERALRMERSQGGQLIKIVQRQFTRLENWRELKIGFEDPTYFHITHGCKDCIKIDMDIAHLQEMFIADQEESPDGYTDKERKQIPAYVVAVTFDAGSLM